MQKEYNKEIPKLILDTYERFTKPQWDLIVDEAYKMSNSRQDYVTNLGKLCKLIWSFGDWINKEMKNVTFDSNYLVDPETIKVIFLPGFGKFIPKPKAIINNKKIVEHKLSTLGEDDDRTNIWNRKKG